MIKFRQKEFFAPLAAIGAKALSGLSIAGNAAMIGGVFQANSQMKQAEEHAAQAEEQNRRMTKALNRIAENAKNNPQAAQQAADIVGQRQFAKVNLGSVFNDKNLQNAKGLAKDVGKIVWKGKNKLIGGTMMGATMAGASYLTDKAIQKDMKKNGMPLEKTYSAGSIMKAVKGTGKVLGEAAKKNKGTLITMAALGSAPMALGYSAEKAQYKDQMALTQRNYAVPGVMAVKRLLTGASKSVRNSQIFKTPGQTILGGLSNLSGGGGRKGVYKFGHQLNRYGKHSGSVWSQKAGKFIMDNPKTALAGSIPVGAAVLGATWGTGEKIVNKTARALDKDAFKYQDSKNQEIQ